jgi:SRSO17 transposase
MESVRGEVLAAMKQDGPVASDHASLPIAWRLYLPESWTQDRERRKAAGIPSGIVFQTKPAIALAQIRRAAAQGIPTAPVLADAAYGNDSEFREGLTALHGCA